MNSTPALKAAGIFYATASLWYLFTETLSAAAFPGYSYAHNYISDLGIPEISTFEGRVINSPLHNLMNAGFIGHGLFFLLGSICLALALVKTPRLLVPLALIQAFGISMVGLTHGSAASAELGIGGYHFMGAGMSILGGNGIALLALASQPLRELFGRRRAVLSAALGATGFIAVFILQALQTSGASFLFDYGIWERTSVYTITAWGLLAAYTCLTHPATRRRPTGI